MPNFNLEGSIRALQPTAKFLHKTHPDEQINFSVRLKANPEGIADGVDVNNVVWFLQHNQLNFINHNLEQCVVQASGTVKNIEAAFGVELNQYARSDGSTFRHHSEAVSLPEYFREKIIAVLGLDTSFRAKPHHRYMTRDIKNSTSYYPEEVAKLYNFPPGDGTNQVVGIIELGGGCSIDELNTYAMSRGLPLPNVISVGVDGAKNVPGKDPQGADGEVLLDVEIIASIVPKAKVVVYFGPNTSKSFDDVLNFAVNDNVHKPAVISLSWGGPEDSFSKQSVAAMSQTFAKATKLGITVCAASGDNGSTDGEHGNHVDYPASDVNVLACGGTNLQSSNKVITKEVAWGNGNPDDGASGGGLSILFGIANWQRSVSPKKNDLENLFNKNHRFVPDVSSNADPNSGFNVLIDGSTQTIGGTSAASPMISALVVLLNENLNKRVGLLQPVLYKHASKCIRNIVGGSNGAYTATPGYNLVCGLGVIDGTKLLEILKSN